MRALEPLMNSGIRLRLAALGSGVALVGALIIVVTLNSESKARQVRDRLSQVDFESFRIADRFKEKLRTTNDKLRRYASANERSAWQEFLDASQELKAWIDQQQVGLSNEPEMRALRQMDSGYQLYLQKAMDVHARMESSGASGASLAEYNGFLDQARRFFDLGQDLARAHFDSRNQVLTHASRTLSELRLVVLGLVGLLLLVGVVLALVAYRDLIAPLRVRLVESQAIAERHEKLASLGLLAAGVAHEIRNPLTAIKAALFIQQKQIEPNSQEDADAALVERELLRLERIVNGFLQFARPAEPELATTSAGVLLLEVQRLLGEQVAKANIKLIREDSAAMAIRVDPGQIKQVLINLVQNAAESMNGPGTIILRARPDRRRLTNGEIDVVVLEVADTGKGIMPDVEKRLFDPFFTTKDTGTGLGLSIAARIVERHGGLLQYQTLVNRGTTFGVVLNRA